VSWHIAAAPNAVGANVQYTELPGVGHNVWNPAYERQDVIARLLEQKKQ
jgi:hypothetical protein